MKEFERVTPSEPTLLSVYEPIEAVAARSLKVGEGKQYVFDGNRPGRILVDGVDTDINLLTDSERVIAGEQLLKRIELQSGVEVSKLRLLMADIAEKAKGQTSSTKQAPVLQLVKTAHGTEQKFLAMKGKNRKQRRAERSGKR